MKNHSDWTKTRDQNIIAKKANYLVDDLLKQIFNERLEIHNNLNLTLFDLNLLYGWQFHVGANAFIERLLRVLANKTNVVEKTSPFHLPADKRPLTFSKSKISGCLTSMILQRW